MSSPVERLEAWCDSTTLRIDSNDRPHEHPTVQACRAIIAKYREVEDPNLGEDWVVKDVLAEVIELLADAVNPEEKNDDQKNRPTTLLL